MSKLNLKASLKKGTTSERSHSEERLRYLDQVQSATPPNIGSKEQPPSSSAVVTSGVARSIVKVLLDGLISNPFNPRTFYLEEGIRELGQTLESDGQIEPIKVTYLDGDSFPTIIDGERRVRAARIRGFTELDAEILANVSRVQLYERAYRANKERAPQTVLDDAVAWPLLIERGVYKDQSDLAATLGYKQAYVTKVCNLSKLPMEILGRMAEAEIGLAMAYNLKLIHDRKGPLATEKALQRVIAGEITVRKIEQIVREADSGTVRSKRRHYESRVDFTSADGVNHGQLKRFDDGRLGLQLTGIVGDDQDALVQRISAAINEIILKNSGGTNA